MNTNSEKTPYGVKTYHRCRLTGCMWREVLNVGGPDGFSARPMSPETREVRPCSVPRRVIDHDGRVLVVPDDWALLPPGDAALSRRIKADGPSWT